ncbi:molybdate ABC transporter substrate-binding protein [Piscinibacter sakaiensis]|uniref:Molybdenum ABC transporter, periplasmic molybdenum-binding protein ModA n=1 Tax=Piscinibacter sakaiensis TaxID=1547922 RepID=A0A0K8NX82_PISS1|nr:molybdate ABC transporter substrate-binding protein [Piscinibacter sakaiensis]GAP34986.1 molybdenum ABC transporter, periplasmic molybdenum-binding protein ModA [Piscinibacter sakaiensis]
MPFTTLTTRLRGALLATLLGAAGLAAQAADLTVSAAASLTNAFRELAPVFEAGHPGTKLLLNFAASDALLAQIAKGAPADVFAAADQESMDRAEAQKLLVPGTRRDFVANALVLIAPTGTTAGVAALADLQQAGVRRVAIGNPGGVPAGRYAKAALEAAGLWAAVEPKAVLATNVRQALDYVARGEVDAGFVYATDAAIQKDKVRLVATVPTEKPILYPIAAVAGGPNAEGARQFLAFLQTPPAQAVLAKYGFRRP